MGDAAEKIVFDISAKGARDTAGDFKKVADAQRDVTGATKEHNSASEEALHRSHDLGRAFQVVRTELSLVSPALGSMAESMHIAASEGRLLAEAIGIGAAGGLVAGGIVGALSLYISHQHEAEEATKKAKEEIEKQALAARNATKAIDDLAASVAKVHPGDTDPAQLAKLQTLGAATYGRRDVGVDASGVSYRSALLSPAQLAGRAAAYNDLSADIDAQRVKSINDAKLAAINALDDNSASLGIKSSSEQEAGAAAAAQKAITARIALAEARTKIQTDEIDRQIAQTLRAADAEKLIREADAAHAKITKDFAQRDDEAMRAKRMADGTELDKTREKSFAISKRQHEAYKQVGLDAFQSVASVGINALQELAKGHHVSFKQIIAGIGDSMVASGTRWLFEGLAMSAAPELFGGAGPVMAGIGTAEIAAGLALGAAGSSGGKGGGGGASTGGTQGRQEYQRAHSPLTPSNDNGGQYPTAVNVYYQSTFPPTARDGAMVVRAIKEGQRQGYV